MHLICYPLSISDELSKHCNEAVFVVGLVPSTDLDQEIEGVGSYFAEVEIASEGVDMGMPDRLFLLHLKMTCHF